MRNIKTIGGGSPFEDPVKLHSQVLGTHIVAMSSTKYAERRQGYINLMALRRFFTIDQWNKFNKDMDTFRKDRNFASLTEMIRSISSEMIHEGVEKPETIKKEELMVKTTEITSSENGNKIRQLIEGLAKVTAQLAELTNRVASIVPVLPVSEIVADPVQKGKNALNEAEMKGSAKKSEEKTGKIKKSAGSDDSEKPIDYKKVCRECVASICRHFQELGPCLEIFKKHEVNGLNSAPVEKLPAIYRDLKDEVDKIEVLDESGE